MQDNIYDCNITLCPNCFAQLNAQGRCPICGYDSTQVAENDYGKLTPGTVLKDRYYIGMPLGQGGFGITYLSYDLMLGIKLAIKEYYPAGIATRLRDRLTVTNSTAENGAEFKEGLSKFLTEARTLARFSNHPNIVPVRDYFEYNGTAYMVMGYLEGQTLLQYLKSHGNKLSFKKTCEVLTPIMDALNAVHASGLIHRDISPDNIFMTKEGTVKLLDFGAAKSAMALMNQQNHSIVLKKGYSPSEQYREDGRLGPWTDIYSMGATFYRCLTGEVPQDSIDRLFEDKTQNMLYQAADTPATAMYAIMKAMSINEADRYQNMSDFKDALLRQKPAAVATSPVAEYPPEPLQIHRQPVPDLPHSETPLSPEQIQYKAQEKTQAKEQEKEQGKVQDKTQAKEQEKDQTKAQDKNRAVAQSKEQNKKQRKDQNKGHEKGQDKNTKKTSLKIGAIAAVVITVLVVIVIVFVSIGLDTPIADNKTNSNQIKQTKVAKDSQANTRKIAETTRESDPTVKKDAHPVKQVHKKVVQKKARAVRKKPVERVSNNSKRAPAATHFVSSKKPDNMMRPTPQPQYNSEAQNAKKAAQEAARRRREENLRRIQSNY